MSRALNAQTAAASDHAGTFEVPAVTIDGLAEKYGRPDVLFIDIEGMEADALRGAARTLAACPDAFVEVHTGCGLEQAGGSVAAVLGYFPPERYDLYVHTEPIPVPVKLSEAGPAVLRDRFFLTALARR